MSVPNGKEFYQSCLEFHTSVTDLDAEQIHDIGLEEIEQLRAGVAEVQAELGKAELTFNEFTEWLKSQPSQSFQTEEEILV